MKDKELIWVEREFAEQYKSIESDNSKQTERIKIFQDYIEKVKQSVRDDFKANLETLQEDEAIFVGLMLHVKQAFEKAKNEQLSASYALWEKFESEIPNVKEKTNNIVNSLEPLVNKLKEVDSMLSKIKTYDLDRVIESIEKLSGLYGTSKEMINFLVNNFKSKDSK